MIKNIRHHFISVILIFVAFFSLVPSATWAVGEGAYLTPASGTSQPGNTFTVSADGFVPASFFGTHSATGTLSFPANLLKVVSISSNGSTFPNSTVTPNNSAGTISYNQSCPWYCAANNQTVHLFTVTFQALNNGVAKVNFSGASYDGYGTSTAGGTYTISTPVPPTPSPTVTPKPSATPTPSTTPKPSVKPSTAPSPTITPTQTPTPIPAEETPAPTSESDGGLKIEDIKVVATRQENSVTFTINNPAATPTISYGTTKSSLKDEGTPTKQDDGSYKVIFPNLKLGSLYYFTIKAATTDNLQGATYNGTLTTRGYPVQLTIQQNNLLLPGAKLNLDGRSFVANKDAIITTELSDGTHKATITAPGTSDGHEVTFVVAKKPVPANGSPVLQTFILNATIVGSSSGLKDMTLLLILGLIAAAIALTIGVIGFILLRRRRSNDNVTSVDTDMIAASYGSVIEDRVSRTPVANLETTNVGPTTTDAPYEEAYPEQPLEPLAATVESEQQYADTEPTPFDPSALPLPPPTEPQVAAVEPYQPSSDSYSEGEQLSPEISSIEASEPIDPDAASAVYHDDTGELDIIHHNAHESAIATPPVEVQGEPSNVSDMSQLPSPPEINVAENSDANSTQPSPEMPPLAQQSLTVVR